MKTSICMTVSKLVLGLLSLWTTAFVHAQTSDFCWKDSYGRGAGIIPKFCPAGMQNDAGLCYTNCKAGYSGLGPVCWSGCPAGYADHGAVCHINKPLTTGGTWECTARGLFDECWWSVLRCPAGYTNAGLFCALTSAGMSPPAGFSGTFLDPMKNSYPRGAGIIPTGCSAGQVNQAGLCYDNCKVGYSGVGPVCWAGPPATWKDCGLGAAKASFTCDTIVFSQVGSVANLALGVWKLSTSAIGESGVQDLRDMYAKMRVALTAVKAAVPEAKIADELVQEIQYPNPTPADMARVSAKVVAALDPTGVAHVVGAFTYPKCSAIFK